MLIAWEYPPVDGVLCLWNPWIGHGKVFVRCRRAGRWRNRARIKTAAKVLEGHITAAQHARETRWRQHDARVKHKVITFHGKAVFNTNRAGGNLTIAKLSNTTDGAGGGLFRASCAQKKHAE